MRTVTRTERGWAGHFICGNRCVFHRNTLLECGDVRIVVSTVGKLPRLGNGKPGLESIGLNRYSETMAFYAAFDGKYWDADVSREVDLQSPCALGKDADDNQINDMHEKGVAEISERLAKGETFV